VGNTYTKGVTSELQRAENILKLVGTPSKHLKDSFGIIMGPEGTGDILTKIMELKGMKASEIKDFISKMGLDLSSPGVAGKGSPVASSGKMPPPATGPAFNNVAKDVAKVTDVLGKMFKK
jgi:hypothetical protein